MVHVAAAANTAQVTGFISFSRRYKSMSAKYHSSKAKAVIIAAVIACLVGVVKASCGPSCIRLQQRRNTVCSSAAHSRSLQYLIAPLF
jgi:hypothetical protein